MSTDVDLPRGQGEQDTPLQMEADLTAGSEGLTTKQSRNASGETLPLSEDCPTSPSNAKERVMLRSLTYFIYDCFSVTGKYKEMARVAKAFVELLVDERFPPPSRAAMSWRRKFMEFLFAPAVSSLIWFIRANAKSGHKYGNSHNESSTRLPIVAKALGTVAHRVARQVLIYRLFFRIGSKRYTLASALGIVCCFFKDTLFRDLLRFGRWPEHFSKTQGIAALIRSIVYAVAFSLPVQHLSKLLQESCRRRGNAKKILFTMALPLSQRLLELMKRVSSAQM